MNPLSEQEVEDLLGAYALGALAGSDLERVRQHLDTCPGHAAVADDLRRVTTAIALSVDDREPSSQLRDRIMTAVQSPTGYLTAAPTRWWRRLPLAPIAAAAAILLLVFGVVIGRLSAPQPAHVAVVTYTFHGNAHAPNAVARIDYFSDDRRAVVVISGLQPLSGGQVYEMWLFRGNSPVDAGVAGAPAGTLAAQLRDLSSYSQFAVTVEPGEQVKPTTTPILVGKLRSS